MARKPATMRRDEELERLNVPLECFMCGLPVLGNDPLRGTYEVVFKRSGQPGDPEKHEQRRLFKPLRVHLPCLNVPDPVLIDTRYRQLCLELTLAGLHH